MNYKKQLDADGFPLSKEWAVTLSKRYMSAVKELKDELITEHDYGVNVGIWDFLNEIKAKILKFKITEEVLMEEYNQFKQLCEGMIYVDEEFKNAEMAAIERMKVEPKDNFFDYYE